MVLHLIWQSGRPDSAGGIYGRDIVASDLTSLTSNGDLDCEVGNIGLSNSGPCGSGQAGGCIRRLFGVSMLLAAMAPMLAGCSGMSSPFEATPVRLVSLQDLLKTYPAGGRQMARSAAVVVTRDPSKAAFLASISQNANEMQQAAIGSALYQASRGITESNPRGHTEILSAVARSPKAVRAAFLASSLKD